MATELTCRWDFPRIIPWQVHWYGQNYYLGPSKSRQGNLHHTSFANKCEGVPTLEHIPRHSFADSLPPVRLVLQLQYIPNIRTLSFHFESGAELYWGRILFCTVWKIKRMIKSESASKVLSVVFISLFRTKKRSIDGRDTEWYVLPLLWLKRQGSETVLS
jgi:hypothetical protein